MKTLLLSALVIFSFSSLAAISKRDMLRKIDALYEKVSSSKKDNYNDEYMVISNLLNNQAKVDQFADRFTCANGTFDNEFFVFDKVTNKNIGRNTTSEKCQNAVKASKMGLICTRGTFDDEFKIYHAKTGSFLGKKTTYSNCMTAIKSVKTDTICIQGTFSDEFHLHNFKTNQRIGNKTSLGDCLARM